MGDGPPPCASAAPVYGIRCAGIGLLLPAAMAVEYLCEVPVHPLPGAPAGVLGLTQVRGHPRVVLDAGGGAQARGRRLLADVVLIGATSEAACLSVGEAPRALQLRPLASDGAWPRPASGPMGGALRECHVEIEAPQRRWWSFDPERLFALLAGN